MWIYISRFVCILLHFQTVQTLSFWDLIQAFFHGLTLLVHKNWCRPKRCNRVHQEKAVMSTGDRTVGERCDCGCRFWWSFGWSGPYFLQMSPIPSTGWHRPAEDSPCVRKKRTGLCFSMAYSQVWNSLIACMFQKNDSSFRDGIPTCSISLLLKYPPGAFTSLCTLAPCFQKWNVVFFCSYQY